MEQSNGIQSTNLMGLIVQYTARVRSEEDSEEVSRLAAQLIEDISTEIDRNMYAYKDELSASSLESALESKMMQYFDSMSDEEKENACVVEQKQLMRRHLLVPNADELQADAPYKGGIMIDRPELLEIVSWDTMPASEFS